MPRDDLSIDFVKSAKGMPPQEVLDPALILDDWANRVANLPEEIKFIQDEVAEKDRQVAECLRIIDNRDGRIQAWIKQQGSHTPNPREASYRTTINEQYSKAEQLSEDKLNLTRRLQVIMDRHLKVLDRQIKQLYDRNEPGFTDPDDLPSLLRPSAANNSAPSARAVNPSANPIITALSPLAIPTGVAPGPKGASSQIRSIQTNVTHAASSSAPTSPAATMGVKRGTRESSAGPGTTGTLQRGPRSAVGLGSAPNPSSGLARHSSLGPGTPKGHTAAATGGVPRAGSAGPGRTAIKSGTGAPSGRKGTPSGGVAGGRITKKGTPASGGPKSGLQRVRKSAKNSPSSTAESELSEADSVENSGEDSDGPLVRRGTPAHGGRSHGGGGGSMSQIEGGSGGLGRAQGTGPAPRTKREHHHHHGQSLDAHDDRTYVEDDEAGDDKKYCICQKVSFGDMIACDNEECPFEWFHWACVGLKSEPVAGGTWYCPVCTQHTKKDKGK